MHVVGPSMERSWAESMWSGAEFIIEGPDSRSKFIPDSRTRGQLNRGKGLILNQIQLASGSNSNVLFSSSRSHLDQSEVYLSWVYR